MAVTWTVVVILAAGVFGLGALMVQQMNGLRAEVKEEIGKLDAKIDGLETKMDAKIDGLGTEVRRLAETQAEMNGKLDVVVRMAHTHTVTA
ncbi:MAG: hypothetical protein ACYDGY_09105 [Acidimicrobiales bacterium]